MELQAVEEVSNRTNPNSFKKGIKYITISDSKTGFVLCEVIYKWNENTITTNIGNLIQSFYQFAREVDDGSE
jgi:hypothetical protein